MKHGGLKMKMISLLLALVSVSAHAAPAETAKKFILTDIQLLKSVGIESLYEKTDLGVALAEVTIEQSKQISKRAHELGRCGGFEELAPNELSSEFSFSSFSPNQSLSSSTKVEALFTNMSGRAKKDRKLGFMSRGASLPKFIENPVIKTAVAKVEEARLRTWVEWFSAFPTRMHSSPTANAHVDQLKTKIEQMLAGSKIPFTVETVAHNRTKQKSLRVRLTGSKSPNETVVMGGHYDSINQSWMSTAAPGADDNASGSAALLEALRIIAAGEQPQRSIEFMWYAAEEVGLYGSAEIAAAYKAANRDVVGVLQLDMTLHPGDGPLKISSMTDFTSSWLRDFLIEINQLYVGVEIGSDQCGYGCSDHASWYRQGYPTLMPFEASMDTMNSKIHTANDVINSASNFTHAAAFSKIAVAFGLELANSNRREPAN